MIGISCSVSIFRDGKLLLTKRADNGLWCIPGGKLEVGESVAECAIREVKEETGLTISGLKFAGVYSNVDLVRDGKQVIALHFITRYDLPKPEPLLVNPEVTEFAWVERHQVPSPEFPIWENHRERIRQSFISPQSVVIR